MRILQVPSIAAALNASNAFHGFNSTFGAFGPSENSSSLTETAVYSNGTDITGLFNTTNTKFPPRTWLGFGLDMTTITPLDIRSVASSVLTHSRVIKLRSGGREQDVGDVSWLVPDGVDVTDDMSVGDSSYNSYESGTQAAHAISVDATLSARYMAIQGDVSASYAINKAFQKSYQYAMFGYNQVMLRAAFSDYGDQVNEALLRQRMDRIAKFTPKDPTVIQQYRSLFASLGSHIIVAVNYGGRAQLTVWADNSDATVDTNFNVDVAAEFNGLTTGGEAHVGVKGESQFQTFENSVQKTVSCLGGDASLASHIDSDPSAEGIFDTFRDWVKTSQTRPNIMAFQTEAIWDLMASANDSALASRWLDVFNAYQWVVENPEQHRTAARISITSNWGEIGLLTPSAYIMPDPQQPYAPEIQMSTTKITWTGGGGPGREIEISFIIVNDGSPIDIELSHGSEGSTPGFGSITAEIQGKAYVNDKLTDNNWNTLRFMFCPVNPHGLNHLTDNSTANVATA